MLQYDLILIYIVLSLIYHSDDVIVLTDDMNHFTYLPPVQLSDILWRLFIYFIWKLVNSCAISVTVKQQYKDFYH